MRLLRCTICNTRAEWWEWLRLAAFEVWAPGAACHTKLQTRTLRGSELDSPARSRAPAIQAWHFGVAESARTPAARRWWCC